MCRVCNIPSHTERDCPFFQQAHKKSAYNEYVFHQLTVAEIENLVVSAKAALRRMPIQEPPSDR
jgi:hypothetical protein